MSVIESYGVVVPDNGAATEVQPAAVVAAEAVGVPVEQKLEAPVTEFLPVEVTPPPPPPVVSGEKRGRGRPRKYPVVDGAVPIRSQAPAGNGGESGGTPSVTGSGKRMGRPPGSKNKPKVARIGANGSGITSTGAAFTPSLVTVAAGEDISAKIMSYLQNGPGVICIISALGAVSNVTLSQAASSGGTITYEGHFEILSLSGSYTVSECGGGQRSHSGGLKVMLAGSNGQVFGGGVAGLLIAAAPVQVILGGFQHSSESATPKRAGPLVGPSESSGSPSNSNEMRPYKY